jgi:hypothetical protein
MSAPAPAPPAPTGAPTGRSDWYAEFDEPG